MIAARSLRFALDWINERDGETYDLLANVRVEVDGQPVWPVWGDAGTDLDVFADDLLSYLAENWKGLLLEQHYPRGLRPAVPSQLLSDAEDYAEDQPQVLADRLFSAVSAFEASHDFARAIGGQFELPPLWLLRQGDAVIVETGGRVLRLAVEAWVEAATSLGQEIAGRMRGRSLDRFGRLLSAWDARDEGDPIGILSVSIGQPREVSEELVRSGLLRAEPSVALVANDNDVVRIAARMVGSAPLLQIKSILSTVAETRAGSADELDPFAASIRDCVAALPVSSAPHEEGVFAARRLRELLDIAEERSADPFAALGRMGVPIVHRALGLPTLDALAVWGDAHGPAVVINDDSRRFFGNFGRSLTGPAARATVAHEICHLLLDRGRALAAVDILNGRMPPSIEKRAGAFAAEFLLPALTAARIWRLSEFTTDLNGVAAILKRLASRFSVSRQMAAWQLDHGLLGTDPEVLFWLDELYPQRRERGGRR